MKSSYFSALINFSIMHIYTNVHVSAFLTHALFTRSSTDMSEVLLFCLDRRLSMTFPTRVLYDSVINLRMTRDFGGVGFGEGIGEVNVCDGKRGFAEEDKGSA